jgi:hypothetical protein
MSNKPSDTGNLPRAARRRNNPRARLTALIRIGCNLALPDELMKPGWPRWEEAMSILTRILYDIEAEMKTYNGESAEHPCQNWQEAFRRRLRETIEVADDPFFDL